MISTMGWERGQTFCSRTATTSLSLKNDVPEGIDAAWRGHPKCSPGTMEALGWAQGSPNASEKDMLGSSWAVLGCVGKQQCSNPMGCVGRRCWQFSIYQSLPGIKAGF